MEDCIELYAPNAVSAEDDEPEAFDYEANLAAFRAKVALIPAEYHEALGWLYVYRQIQDQRKRLLNRALQFTEGKRVFWASVLPPEMAAPMASHIHGAAEKIVEAEELAGRRVHKALVGTSWYQDVAVPAARGVGISEKAGAISAAKILDAYASPSRFASFGAFVRYSRLAPEGGKAPKRQRGAKIHYNPKAWQALFDLSESWNRMPSCCWRAMWDGWKIAYAEKYPDYPKGRIHNMARRKILREFLRDLWDLWRAWEEERRPGDSLPTG